MKLTKSKLHKIIKEELQKELNERRISTKEEVDKKATQIAKKRIRKLSTQRQGWGKDNRHRFGYGSGARHLAMYASAYADVANALCDLRKDDLCEYARSRSSHFFHQFEDLESKLASSRGGVRTDPADDASPATYSPKVPIDYEHCKYEYLKKHGKLHRDAAMYVKPEYRSCEKAPFLCVPEMHEAGPLYDRVKGWRARSRYRNDEVMKVFRQEMRNWQLYERRRQKELRAGKKYAPCVGMPKQ